MVAALRNYAAMSLSSPTDPYWDDGEWLTNRGRGDDLLLH